jgi:hypothetical protein
VRATLTAVETVWQDLKYGAIVVQPRLCPLAVPKSAGVVGVYRGDARPCSYPDFLDFERRVTAFSGIAADVTNWRSFW